MKNLINRRYKKILFLFFIILLTEAFLETISVAIFVPFLQQFFDGDIKFASLDIFLDQVNLNILLFMLVIFFLIKNLLVIFFAYIKIKLINSYKTYVKEKLIKLYLSADLQLFLQKKKSESIRNLFGEVDSYVTSYVAAILEIIKILMIFSFVIIFLFFYDFKTTIVVLPTVSILVLIFLFATRNKLLSLGKERALLSRINLDKISRLVSGMIEIKLFQIGKYYAENLMKTIKKFDNLAIPRAIIGTIPRSFIEFFIITVFSVTIFYLLEFKDLSKENTISLISIYLIAALRMFPYIGGITSLYNRITQGQASYEILKADFKTLSNTKNKAVTKKKYIKKFDSIEFSNISFNYQGFPEQILKDVNLKIFKGDKIGIVGSSGSGKSTFLNILMGFLKPVNGNIKINDKITNNETYSSLYDRVAYLTQEPYFLFDTISENISKYNQNKNITLNQINETLALVKLQKFSLTSEKSKNDFIGENGSNLSGGERQRLAIAGAICKKADIMIFDEITNKLDETNEKLIMDTLYETNKDKTMIIVSHNKSNLSKCDYILEIQNKSVIRVLNKK